MKAAAKKEDKRARILAAARELLQPRSLELPSVSAITGRAGIAKGTFYLYFDTREELFLSMLFEGYQAAADSLQSALAELPVLSPDASTRPLIEAVSRGYLAFAARDPQALYLSGIAVAILESNVSDEIALKFKQGGLKLMQELTAATQRICDGRWPFEEIARRHLLSFNTVIVLWQNAHPPANIERLVAAHPELAMVRPNFEDSVNHALALIWA